MTGYRLLLLPLAIALLGHGCGDGPPPSVRISVTNDSGADLAVVRLDWGPGSALFDRVPAGHTQTTFAEINTEQNVRLRYVDAVGSEIDVTLGRTLTTGLLGGGYDIRIRPDGVISLRADWP